MIENLAKARAMLKLRRLTKDQRAKRGKEMQQASIAALKSCFLGDGARNRVIRFLVTKENIMNIGKLVVTVLALSLVSTIEVANASSVTSGENRAMIHQENIKHSVKAVKSSGNDQIQQLSEAKQAALQTVLSISHSPYKNWEIVRAQRLEGLSDIIIVENKGKKHVLVVIDHKYVRPFPGSFSFHRWFVKSYRSGNYRITNGPEKNIHIVKYVDGSKSAKIWVVGNRKDEEAYGVPAVDGRSGS